MHEIIFFYYFRGTYKKYRSISLNYHVTILLRKELFAMVRRLPLIFDEIVS